MATITELIDDFIACRTDANASTLSESNAGFEVSENQLWEIEWVMGQEVRHPLAGWDRAGEGVETSCWLAASWRGFLRTNLELKLRKINMVVMTITPTEDYDDHGAEVIWWAYPVECMSCADPLSEERRLFGICEACEALRNGGIAPGHEHPGGYEQRRGLHGDTLPRKRPGSGTP